MLKRKALNRIFISTIILFIVLVVYSLNIITKDTVNIYEVNNYKTNYSYDLYTINNDNYVSKTSIYVSKELSTLEKIKQLIETMIEKNNKNALLPSYFKPILPQNTKILNVLVEDGLIKINFSKELLNITEEQSEKMIEAIVYTLTSIKEINGVEINVENQLLKFVPNTKKQLPTILTRDFGINKVYEINSNENINKVVLYFLGEDNNYIPITKYVNDEREKIEIIVENLTNKYVFSDNLVSLLNSKAKIINYTKTDEVLSLNFNEYIFSDDSVSEEIINSISYSVFDSYEVNTVSFSINNNKIIEKSIKNVE